VSTLTAYPRRVRLPPFQRKLTDTERMAMLGKQVGGKTPDLPQASLRLAVSQWRCQAGWFKLTRVRSSPVGGEVPSVGLEPTRRDNP